MLLHRVLNGREGSGVGAELGIGAFALGLHAFLDGSAIFEHEEAGSTTRMLAAAVILHRLPVGIGVWWLVRPRFGRRTAVAVLILLAIATVSGSFFSQGLIEGASANIVAVLQALFAGSVYIFCNKDFIIVKILFCLLSKTRLHISVTKA
jgi:zinc transporter ZupT